MGGFADLGEGEGFGDIKKNKKYIYIYIHIYIYIYIYPPTLLEGVQKQESTYVSTKCAGGRTQTWPQGPTRPDQARPGRLYTKLGAPRYVVLGLGYEVLGLGCEVLGLGYEVLGPGCEVLGLG